MICFLVNRDGAFSMESYREFRGQEVADRITILCYDELADRSRLPLGTYVFSALDQLSPADREIAGLLWDRLSHTVPRPCLLNHPMRALRRYELLRRLHRSGCNCYQAKRATEPIEALRLPVFVRAENEHNGNLSELLMTREDVNRALGSLMMRGWHLDDLLVVEFCDTADDEGMFRKYSAFKLGAPIIPRCVNFSRGWMVKHDNLSYDASRAQEELAYMEENPHEAWLQEVFRSACIEYGRIDYAMLDDRPQVWEINLNPTIGRTGPPKQRTPAEEAIRELRRPARELFYRRFRSAWEEIDSPRDGTEQLALSLPRSLRRRSRADRRRARRRVTRRRVVQTVGDNAAVRQLRRVLEPTVLRVVGALLGRGRRLAKR